MDNIGDWLYIALMAGAIVISLLNSRKKKKQETAPREMPYPEEEALPETDEKKGFWDVLREMQEQEEAKQRQARQQQEQAAKATHQVKAGSPFLKGEKTFRQTTRPTPPVIEPTPEPILNPETFTDPEELRKAVIYAEILNRKY